jgi:hypothetical protein
MYKFNEKRMKENKIIEDLNKSELNNNSDEDMKNKNISI